MSPDAHTDVPTHGMSVTEAGGVTLMPEVPKVTRQVSACWGWLPGAMRSAHIVCYGIGETFHFHT